MVEVKGIRAVRIVLFAVFLALTGSVSVDNNRYIEGLWKCV